MYYQKQGNRHLAAYQPVLAPWMRLRGPFVGEHVSVPKRRSYGLPPLTLTCLVDAPLTVAVWARVLARWSLVSVHTGQDFSFRIDVPRAMDIQIRARGTADGFVEIRA